MNNPELPSDEEPNIDPSVLRLMSRMDQRLFVEEVVRSGWQNFRAGIVFVGKATLQGLVRGTPYCSLPPNDKSEEC